MRSTAFDLLLTLWLVTSLGFWLFGLAFAGQPYLPELNAFTALVLYAPWLILAAVSVLRPRSSAVRHHGGRIA